MRTFDGYSFHLSFGDRYESTLTQQPNHMGGGNLTTRLKSQTHCKLENYTSPALGLFACNPSQINIAILIKRELQASAER